MKRVLTAVMALALLVVFAGLAFAGERTEVVSMRTEYAKVFNNGNGKWTAEVANHAIHKKNVVGAWVDIAPIEAWVAKVAENEVDVSIYQSYCVNESTSSVSVGESYVGLTYGSGSPENRTAYQWYTAGLPPMDITEAHYDTHLESYSHPLFQSLGAIIDGIRVSLLSYEPRWSNSTTIWNDCVSNIQVTLGFQNRTNYGGVLSIELNQNMIDDLEAATPNRGWFGLGHSWPNGSENLTKDYYFYRIGNSSTLYITYDSPRKIAISSDSTVGSIAVMPNPFNPATTISFQLSKSSDVTLDVYSINGQKVATLVNGPMQSGVHFVKFDGSHLASGVYFYKISTPYGNQTGKMRLLK